MNAIEVFLIFLRLGLTSFGGPVAHLGYFYDEFVKKRRWLDEQAYGDLVALCQFLPGPASSQVGMALGLSRAGIFGAMAAWIGFTLPSATILILLALGVSSRQVFISNGWIHGLKVAAVAVVAQAIWGMAKKLCPDWKRASLAALATAMALVIPNPLGQLGVIAVGGIIGISFLRINEELPHAPFSIALNRAQGALVLIVFFFLLATLPIVAAKSQEGGLQMFDSFFRAGSLVFGGGHVVLPLLKAEVVPQWLTADVFMAGYGAAQAIPGPLFAFSAYIGALSPSAPTGVIGGALCLVAAFLPSFLLVLGVLPFWEILRGKATIRFAMSGINASVVGLLMAAFYNPVWTSAILSWKDFALAVISFLALTLWTVPSWAVVVFCAVVGGLWL